MKSLWQHLPCSHSSLWVELSWKKSLLVIQKVLGQLVNTLTTDGKYSLLNREKLTQPIQMQIYKKTKVLVSFCSFKNQIKFWIFWRIRRPWKLIYFRNYRLRRTCSDKSLKGFAWQESSTSNMAHNPKHCWNLRDTNFVIVIDHSELKDSWKKYFLVIQKNLRTVG